MILMSRFFTSAFLVLFIAISSQMAATTKASAQEANQSIPNPSEIEKLVRDYILKNPEIIVEALQIFEERQQSAFHEQQKVLIDNNKDLLVSSKHQAVFGNPDGDVTLIEFFDYNCHFCRDSLENVQRLIDEDKNLKVVLKEFPVLGPQSQEAARVAIAAAKIDAEKYLKLHVELLKARGQADERTALALAKKLDYDMDALQDMMAKPVIEEAINEVYGLANVLGLTGTPTFIIGNDVMPGAVGHAVLREKLDSMRKCGQTTCS